MLAPSTPLPPPLLPTVKTQDIAGFLIDIRRLLPSTRLWNLSYSRTTPLALVKLGHHNITGPSHPSEQGRAGFSAQVGMKGTKTNPSCSSVSRCTVLLGHSQDRYRDVASCLLLHRGQLVHSPRIILSDDVFGRLTVPISVCLDNSVLFLRILDTVEMMPEFVTGIRWHH